MHEPLRDPVDPVHRPDRTDLAAFAVISLAALVVTFAAGRVAQFYYDADGYWNISRTLTQDGHWSLFHLRDLNRGYLPVVSFGALRGVTEAIGLDARDVVRVVNGLLFGVVGGVLLPRFAMQIWPQARFGLGRRCLVGAVLIVFWSGYLAYPLTDFPTLAFALVAMLLAGRSRSLPWLFVAGVAAGMAVNFRPAYVLLGLGVVALGVARAGRGGPRPWRRRLAALAVLAVGVGVVAAPQVAVNRHNFGISSPLAGAAAKLGPYQLTVGLQMQLYSTYVGDNLTRPAQKYLDPAGAKLIRPEDLDPAQGLIKNTPTYLGIGLRDPVGMAGVIGRHVINALDQRYATPYPTRLDTGQRRPFRVFGFVIVFLAVLRLCWPSARRALGPARPVLLGLVLLSVLTSLPAAVEQRFLLPVFATAVLVVVAPGWRSTFAAIPTSRRPVVAVAVAISLGLFLAGTSAVTSSTSSHMQLVPAG